VSYRASVVSSSGQPPPSLRAAAGGAEAIGVATYPDNDDELYHHTGTIPLGFAWARKS